MIFFLFLFICSSLSANTSIITFQDLPTTSLHNQEVMIRGFLYATEDGRWIVSSEPNLKTCCIGSSQKAQSQVILDSTFEEFPSNRAIALQGTLTSVNGVFHLTNARVLEETGIGYAVVLGCLAFILGGVWVGWHCKNFFNRNS